MPRALRGKHVHSNARPKTGVCNQYKLAGFSPGIPQLASLSREGTRGVQSQLGTSGGLRRSRPVHNAGQNFEYHWPISSRKGRGHFHSETANIFHSLATRAGSGGPLQTLPKYCPDHEKSQSLASSNTGSGPNTPLEHGSNEYWEDNAQTRGNIFESPRHLEELALPEETKRFIRVLKNPDNGSLVYLIGTAHVSKACVADVRLLIEAVKPDVVAVELDREGLELIECNLTAAARGIPLRTTWEALRVVRTSYSGHFGELWSAYQPHIESQALGIPYGCDTRSAILAARRIGARIEPIDQSIATIASSLEEFDHAQFHEGAKTALSGIVKVPQSMALMLQLLKEYALKASDGEGGANAQNEAAAFGRIAAAFLNGQPAPLDDIAVFQSLKNKALEASRLDCFNGRVLPAFDENEGPNVYTALLHERDRFMGLKLAALASNRMKVVAVVGAAHVPGITSRFAQYTAGYRNPFDEGWRELDFEKETRPDKESKERESFVQENGRQTSTWEDSEAAGLGDGEVLRRAAVFATAASVGAFAWCTWPIPTLELITGAFTAHGLLTLGLAAFTAKWAQFGEYLEAASLELRRKNTLEWL